MRLGGYGINGMRPILQTKNFIYQSKASLDKKILRPDNQKSACKARVKRCTSHVPNLIGELSTWEARRLT